MKKLLLTALVSGLAIAAYAQGAVGLNNLDNPTSTPTSTSGGQFYLDTGSGPVLINQDFNAVFIMGPASGPTITDSFIGSGAAADNLCGPGTFSDPSGNPPPAVPGVASGSCTMTIRAWLGSSTTYAG